jgi:hypothetical protein
MTKAKRPDNTEPTKYDDESFPQTSTDQTAHGADSLTSAELLSVVEHRLAATHATGPALIYVRAAIQTLPAI